MQYTNEKKSNNIPSQVHLTTPDSVTIGFPKDAPAQPTIAEKEKGDKEG